MKKLLLLLLSASAALTVMAGLLPSTSLCQLMSEREEALDDVLLQNSSANLLPVLDMTSNETSTMGSLDEAQNDNHDNGGSCVSTTNHAPRHSQSTGNVNMVKDGNAVAPDYTGHGGVIHRPIDPRPIRPGKSGMVENTINFVVSNLFPYKFTLPGAGVGLDLDNDGVDGYELQGEAVGASGSGQSTDTESIETLVSALLKGDVNRNGHVNIDDVTTLIDALLINKTENSASFNSDGANVNEDGTVDIADVTALIDLLLSEK
ncbi:MAG: dockerin type I repeat-containing protein [Muribaculaceae bacterium]|nr:dockerin type I repeat-containing protein [Muribaculaceae bacterium]